MADNFDIENTNIKQFLKPSDTVSSSQTQNISNTQPESNNINVENTNIKHFLRTTSGKLQSTSNTMIASNVNNSGLSDVVSGSDMQGKSLFDRLGEGVSRLEKGAQAFATGAEAFGSTIAKGISAGVHAILPESIAKYVAKPKDIQRYYNEMSQEYSKNVAENPGLGALNFAGSIAGSSVIPGTGLYKAAGEVGKAAFGTAGQIAGNILGGAVYGGLVGGANTQEGQQTLLNERGMRGGALAGGALGPVQGAIANSIEKVPGYNKTMSLVNTTINDKPVQFKGPVFDPLPNYETGRIDQFLQKMPSYLGTNPYLEAENKAFRPYIADMINAVSGNNINASKTVIGNELNRRAITTKQLMTEAWEGLPKAYSDAGIKSIPAVNDTLSNLHQNLMTFGDKSFSPLVKQVEQLNRNKAITPEAAIKMKQELGDYFNLLGKKVANGSATITEKQVYSKAILPAFWSLGDDIGNAAKGTSADEVFQYANSLSKGYHNTFDPQVHPLLVNAIDDINESRRGVKALISELIKPNTKLESGDVNKYLDVMGPVAKNELENIGLRSIAAKSGIPELIDNNMNVANKSLNLSSFLTAVDKRIGESSATKSIYTKSYDALKGLEILGKNYLQTVQGAPDQIKQSAAQTIGSIPGKILQYGAMGSAAGYGAVSHPVAAGAVAASVGLSTAAMSYIKANSPLTNRLSWLSKALESEGVQPELTQYLMQKANDNILRAGMIYVQQPNGTVIIDKKDDKKPKKELINSLAVRD